MSVNQRQNIAYGLNNPLQGLAPEPIVAQRAPATNDYAEIGTLWVDVPTDTVYCLTSIVANIATWTTSPASGVGVFTSVTVAPGNVDVTNGDVNIAAGNLAVTAGNASIGGNLTVAGDVAVSGDFDLTSAQAIDVISTFNGAPAINLEANGGAAEQIIIQSLQGTSATSIDIASTAGGVTISSGLASASAITLSAPAGGISIAPDAATSSVGIGNVAPSGARVITISGGNQAQNDTVSVLNGAPSAGTQTFNVLSGTATGGTQVLNLGNGIAGSLTVNMANGINSTAQTVNIANGASAGNSTVNILSGVGTAGAGVLALGNNQRVTTIGLGNIAPLAARVTTINGGNSAQNDTVSILNGAPSAGVQTVNILSGAASGGTQTLNLAAGASAKAVNIGTGAAVVNTIAIGGTGANVITIGDAQTAGSIAMGTAMTTGTVSIGGTGAQIGNFDLAPGTGAQTITLGNGGTAAKTINIGNGIVGNTISLGNGANTSAQIINLAAGASAANSTVNVLSGNGSAGTQTFNVLTGTRAGAAHIGDGAAAHLVTIGSTTLAAATTIQGGTGGIIITPTAGNISLAPALVSAAAYAATLNARVGQVTLTGQVLASTGVQDLVITNSAITGTTQSVFVSVDNLGTNDAQIQVQRVLLAASTLTVKVKNQGAAALNGDIHVNFWVLN